MQEVTAIGQCGWGSQSSCPLLICWECEFFCMRNLHTLIAQNVRERIESGKIPVGSIRCDDGKKQFELLKVGT